MLLAASIVFLYYTFWTLFMVNLPPLSHINLNTTRTTQLANKSHQPFVDSDHPLQNLFPPRVWAIRIPVILILLGSAVVGSFLSVVMIRGNRKKAAKAKAAAAKKKS